MPELHVDFLRGPGILSAIIAGSGLGYGGFSHAASVLPDGRYLDARDDIMYGQWLRGPEKDQWATVEPGVHIRDPSWERAVKRIRATLEVTQTEYEDWQDNLRAKIGTPYAGWDIWGFVTLQKVDIHGMWDCSQLAINALQHIGKIHFPFFVEAHQINPNVALLLMQQAKATLSDVTHLYQESPS